MIKQMNHINYKGLKSWAVVNLDAEWTNSATAFRYYSFGVTQQTSAHRVFLAAVRDRGQTIFESTMITFAMIRATERRTMFVEDCRRITCYREGRDLEQWRAELEKVCTAYGIPSSVLDIMHSSVNDRNPNGRKSKTTSVSA